MIPVSIVALPMIVAIISSSSPLHPMPDCGVASVYAVVSKFGRTTSLAEVRNAIMVNSEITKSKEFSLSELKKGVVSFGVCARSVRVTPGSLQSLSLPSILYVRPERLYFNESHVGHFFVLENVIGDRATVLDLTRTATAWEISVAELFTFWDGECLEISERPFLVPIGWAWTIAWGVIFCVSLISLFKLSRKPSRLARSIVGILFVVCVSGCEKSQLPLLSFEKQVYNAESVKAGGTVDFTCAFLNSSGENVVISEVKASCDCMTPDKSLEGVVLKPGDKRSIVVSMDTSSRVGEIGGTVTLITEPVSPVVISAQVSSFVEESPQLVHSLPVQRSAILGDRAIVEINVEFYRQKTTSGLTWDEGNSMLCGFEVRRFVSDVQDYASRGNMIHGANRDLLQWTLLAPVGLSVGKHSFELALNLGGGSTEVMKVPVVVSVLHPIRPSVDRLFFGYVRAGESKLIDLAVGEVSADNYSRLQVSCDFPDVLVEKQQEQRLIRLRLSPSVPTGRFTGNVSLSLPDSMVPELLVPFSGIVQSGK